MAKKKHAASGASASNRTNGAAAAVGDAAPHAATAAKPESVADVPQPPSLERKLTERTAYAFLPDDTVASHPLFRFLFFFSRWFFAPFYGFDMVGLKEQPRDKGILFYGRHSTHNLDILGMISRCWDVSGRVTRALFHRLLMQGMPWLRYFGGIPGHRDSAVALLREGFWAGVIPGGSQEAMVGHENCYRVHWPEQRQGFAKVAMEANARLVPFFTRNAEEMRFNPFFDLWNLCRLYVPFEYLTQTRQIPFVSNALYVVGECVWFGVAWWALPVPVRCTTYFGEPVPYDPEEPLEDVVARCKDALQKLINEHQPNAQQGRNYTRALGERWEELRGSRPKFVATVEACTPQFVNRWLRRQADGGKKRK